MNLMGGVRARYGRGTAKVRAKYGKGTGEVRQKYGRDMGNVWAKYGKGIAIHGKELGNSSAHQKKINS